VVVEIVLWYNTSIEPANLSTKQHSQVKIVGIGYSPQVEAAAKDKGSREFKKILSFKYVLAEVKVK
jgi:hypothetical protein